MASVAGSWFSGWGAASKQEENWANDLAEAQHLLRDIAIDLQDRDAKFRRGADAARLTAGIRRRVHSYSVARAWSQSRVPSAPLARRADAPTACAACAPTCAGTRSRRAGPKRCRSAAQCAVRRRARRKISTMGSRLEHLELEALPQLSLCAGLTCMCSTLVWHA